MKQQCKQADNEHKPIIPELTFIPCPSFDENFKPSPKKIVRRKARENVLRRSKMCMSSFLPKKMHVHRSYVVLLI
jgi:hypothetical protein